VKTYFHNFQYPQPTSYSKSPGSFIHSTNFEVSSPGSLAQIADGGPPLPINSHLIRRKHAAYLYQPPLPLGLLQPSPLCSRYSVSSRRDAQSSIPAPLRLPKIPGGGGVALRSSQLPKKKRGEFLAVLRGTAPGVVVRRRDLRPHPSSGTIYTPVSPLVRKVLIKKLISRQWRHSHRGSFCRVSRETIPSC